MFKEVWKWSLKSGSPQRSRSTTTLSSTELNDPWEFKGPTLMSTQSHNTRINGRLRSLNGSKLVRKLLGRRLMVTIGNKGSRRRTWRHQGNFHARDPLARCLDWSRDAHYTFGSRECLGHGKSSLIASVVNCNLTREILEFGTRLCFRYV